MRNNYLNHLKLIKTQFKIAVTFLTGFNGTFNVTSNNKKFFLLNSTTDEY